MSKPHKDSRDRTIRMVIYVNKSESKAIKDAAAAESLPTGIWLRQKALTAVRFSGGSRIV